MDSIADKFKPIKCATPLCTNVAAFVAEGESIDIKALCPCCMQILDLWAWQIEGSAIERKYSKSIRPAEAITNDCSFVKRIYDKFLKKANKSQDKYSTEDADFKDSFSFLSTDKRLEETKWPMKP